METSLESHGFITLLTAPWFLAVVGGFIVLGIAIAYGMRRSRKRTIGERVSAERGAREIYQKDDRGERV